MKINLHRLLLLSILLGLLSSCEHVFDEAFEEDPDYHYNVINNTATTVEVTVEVKQNNGVHVVGSPVRKYTVPAGGVVEVWATSGYTDGQVWNEEKTGAELHWFKVSAASNGRPARSNLNSTSRWVYNKHSEYRASYKLILGEDDF